MVRNIKMQIIWSSVVFVLILIIGFLGVYALQKSMTIKMNYTVSPNIRCEIFITPNVGEEYRIFSNLTGDSHINDNWTLYENTSTLKYLGNSTEELGALYTLRFVNHTNTKVFAEAKGEGVTYASTVMNATNGGGSFEVSVVSNDYEINFYKIYDYTLTASFTNVQFDLTNNGNTLLKCGSNYYIPLGTNLQAKLVSTINYACPDVYGLTINGTSQMDSINSGTIGTTTNIWYNTANQTLFIPESSINGNIVLTSSIYWDGGIATRFAGGTGIQGDPFFVATPKQLALFHTAYNDHSGVTSFEGYTGNNCVNSRGFNYAYYQMTNDIYLNDETFPTDSTAPTANANGLNQWLSNGQADSFFSGILDGNYYKIFGLYLNTPSIYGASFIPRLSGTIKKVIMQSGYVSSSGFPGGFVSHFYGTISECSNYATVISANTAGGICGVSNSTRAKIENCFNAGTIIAPNNKNGGIVGWLRYVSDPVSSTRIINSYNYGTCYSGIFAQVDGDSATNCYYLSSSATNAGGGTSKSNAELKIISNLTGFSSSIWKCVSGVNNGYPIFVGQRL